MMIENQPKVKQEQLGTPRIIRDKSEEAFGVVVRTRRWRIDSSSTRSKSTRRKLLTTALPKTTTTEDGTRET
jgi:hypothetical protein